MTISTQAVNAAIDAIVVALRDGSVGVLGRSMIQHCVVASIDGTPVIYTRNKNNVIFNAYKEGDNVMLDVYPVNDEFVAKLEPLWLPMETREERIRAKCIVQNEAIFIAVNLAKGLIDDAHQEGTKTQLSHVARFGKKGGREVVVAIYNNSRFCLNQVGMDREGNVFLSTCSVGGVLDTTIQSVEEAVDGYEDFSKSELWDVTRVDGKGFTELQAGVDIVKTTVIDMDKPVVLEEEFDARVEANPYPTPDRSDWKPINPKIQVSNYKTIEAVKAALGNIRDMHRFEAKIQLTHVALFGVPGYKETVVALMDGKLFCLNPIFLDHDEPYLATSSVGGNVDHKELDMEARLATYQDWDHNMLWNLVRVDGK
jgi:hypothetical protein